jgi:hypothetical protein
LPFCMVILARDFLFVTQAIYRRNGIDEQILKYCVEVLFLRLLRD